MYTPKDLAEALGWGDDSNHSSQVVRFGRTSAFGLRNTSSSSSGSSRGGRSVLSTLGYPMLELFVREGAAGGPVAHQAVKLQTRQEVERQAAEALPAALLQQRLARDAEHEASSSSSTHPARQRAGTVDFWFDFQESEGNGMVVEIGMSAQSLPVMKKRVRLVQPLVPAGHAFLSSSSSSSSGDGESSSSSGGVSLGGGEGGIEASGGDGIYRELEKGSGVAAALGWRSVGEQEQQQEQGTAAAAAVMGAGGSSSEGADIEVAGGVWSSDELEEMMEVMQELKVRGEGGGGQGRRGKEGGGGE